MFFRLKFDSHSFAKCQVHIKTIFLIFFACASSYVSICVRIVRHRIELIYAYVFINCWEKRELELSFSIANWKFTTIKKNKIKKKRQYILRTKPSVWNQFWKADFFFVCVWKSDIHSFVILSEKKKKKKKKEKTHIDKEK